MRGALGGVLIVVAHFALSAQSQPQTQSQTEPQQPPIFRGGASLVRVDVTVTNRHGEPATTLSAEDFEITEDGAPQTVETFKLVSADGRRAEGDDTSLAIRSPEHAAAEAARDETRVFLIFWDEYHIGRFASAIQARQALADFVTTAFGPTDLVALMNPLLPTDAIRWTRNRTELAQAVQKLEGRSHVYVPARSVLEEGQLYRRDVERLRSEVTVSAMKSAASYLGGLRDGRKAIVFVSEGLPQLDRSDEASLLQDLVRTANDNNTAIYTLDPRGLGHDVADVMWTLAANTGASAFVNTNNPARALRQVVVDASAFYLLGYASTNNPADGKFHQIKVRVKRSGLDVRSRKGYWAPSTTDVDKAARDAANATPPHISNALATLSATRSERALDLWIGTARSSSGSARVTLTWTLRSADNTAAHNGNLVVIADGATGTETLEAALASQQLSFDAAPGDLKLKLTVRDERGVTIDEDIHALSVPDLAHAKLALSSPAAFLARNPLELRNLHAGSVPFAGRQFRRTDRVFVRFTVFGEQSSGAVITARLLSRTGSELRPLAVVAPQADGGDFEIDVPLASLARGDFLIAIDAAAGDERADALLPFRIVS